MNQQERDSIRMNAQKVLKQPLSINAVVCNVCCARADIHEFNVYWCAKCYLNNQKRSKQCVTKN